MSASDVRVTAISPHIAWERERLRAKKVGGSFELTELIATTPITCILGLAAQIRLLGELMDVSSMSQTDLRRILVENLAEGVMRLIN